jgi:hypothetical protein
MRITMTLLQQNKILNLIYTLALTIVFIMLALMIFSVFQAKHERANIENINGKNKYQLSDTLYNEKEKDFFSQNNSYDKLNQFSIQLNKNRLFFYYNANWQPVEIEEANFKGNETFQAYYEEEGPQPSYNFEDKKLIAIKSVQVNQTVLDTSKIIVDKGVEFNEGSFSFRETSPTIPIMMGADYAPYYDLGEEIPLIHYKKEINGKIIGFLAPNQKIMTLREPETNLDRYIVLPLINIVEPTDRSLFLKATLLSKVNGFLITDLSPIEVKKEVDHIGQNVNFNDYKIIGADSLLINIVAQMTQFNQFIILTTSSMGLILILLFLLFVINVMINKNISTYAVLFICGSNLRHLSKKIALKIGILSLVSLLLSLVPVVLVLRQNVLILLITYSIGLLVVVILGIFAYTFALRTLTKVNITQALKG